MDSWTLQGDSYSFLRSAPRTLSLCHRDGTPNHVEIFDIINVPNQSSAISETTCLCDIFGDDCESPSLSSSPAVGAFVPPRREVEETAAASPVVDDLNDSSGSYHTAHGSSEGEDGFEDSGDRLCSPPLQNDSLQSDLTEDKGPSSEHPEVSEDSCSRSKSLSPHLDSSSPLPDISSACGSTPSPGHNSPFTLSQGRASSLSSSSVEKRCSSSLSNPEQAFSEAKSNRSTPSNLEKHKTPSHLSVTPSPSPSPRNCVSLSNESLNTQSLSEFPVAQVSPEPNSSYFHQHRSLSVEPPVPTSRDSSSRATSTPSPSFRELSPHPRASSAHSPELKDRSYSPNTQASSPFPELRRKISLPDLFSRGSTPDIQVSSDIPELVSDPYTQEGDTSATPENQDSRLSAEPVSTSSTPAPRYTPPSPIISVTTHPVESGDTAPSSGLLTATETEASPSPSPDPTKHISSPSDIRTQLSSPAESYSLSPSPDVARHCSPIELIRTAPSPEIRVTASSPEACRRDWPERPASCTEEKSASASPFLESHFNSASSRSLASSPHITGISYSVVQPEDRDSPPFPELLRLSTPQTDSTLVQEAGSPTPSKDSLQSSKEYSGTPQDSPHISQCTTCVLQPDETLSHQSRNQTPSPRTKHLSPSPEARFPTPLSDRNPSPSSWGRNSDPSPVAPSPEQRCHQSSPANLFTEYNPHYKQATPPLRNTPDVKECPSLADITETDFEKECVSPSFESDNGDKLFGVESQNRSPVGTVPSPVSTSPFPAERKLDSSPAQQNLKREATLEEEGLIKSSSLPAFPEVKQAVCPSLFPQEDTINSLSTDTRTPLNLTIPQARSPNISTGKGPSTLQEPENPKPNFNTYTNSKSISSFKPACRTESTRKQLQTSVRRENRERITHDMAHHVHRRRTPSPPLTRFTPVHIIAPEKPYRQWQNRSRSPSQVEASLNTSHLKQVVTNRESPNVAPVDSNSQAQWVRLETQLEMEKEMQLEEDREVVRGRIKKREMEREQKREEQVPEKGKGWQGDASYRGEQVELSFNARNRKGPASHRAAPTSREIRQGLPAVHSYSENLLATRRLQQHSLLASQQDTRGVGPSRRSQPPSALQHKNTTPGRAASNRPCRSSSSSMGSELDDADHEVKWFSDVAFSSLSSPEVDYLDMYNSSHRSSTNISQPSTQGSPAGISAAWPAYADFRGSAQRLDNDELSFQQPYAYSSDGLDPSRRYEMGSFECVDVAVEREDRKVRRGVPKRQIQLKRKNNTEGKQDESSENSSPGVPVMLESSSLESHSSETFMRQHSTPDVGQDCYPSELSPEPNQQNERTSSLQKSPSLDESCAKAKMATCLIKSVLSKKMQSVDKQPDEQADEEVHPSFEENSPSTETAVLPLKESPKTTLSSSIQSDYSFSSESPSVRETNKKEGTKTTRSSGVKSSNRPSSSSSSRSVTFSQTESEDADSESRSATSSRSEIKSELKVSFDSQHSRSGVQQADDRKTWNDREAGESANAAAGNTGAPSVTRACNMQARSTNRDQECENTEDHKQLQQGDKSTCTSNTPEMTLKAVEKKKASLNVCLTPEAENKPEDSPDTSFREKVEREETCADNIAEEGEGNGNNQVKVPIHKVRDVRRLVKNTYNLSFKAIGTIPTVNDEPQRGDQVKDERMEDISAEEERRVRQEIRGEEREGEVKLKCEEELKMEVKNSNLTTLSAPIQSKRNSPSHPQPMQIQYRAVCSKDDKSNMCSNKTESANLEEKLKASPKPATNESKESQMSSRSDTESTLCRETAISTSCQQDLNLAAAKQETVTMSENESKPTRTDRKPPMLGSLPRQSSKEREVSTAVVLIRDGSSRTKTSAFSAQEDISTKIQATAVSPGAAVPGSSGHSVSMLLKEKGYQADIGAVVGDHQNNVMAKGVSHKHVNCLEIPLQTTASSDEGQKQSHRERTFSSSSTLSGPSAASENTNVTTKTREEEEVVIKPPIKDTAKQKISLLPKTVHEPPQPPTKQKELGDFEAVKRLDPTFPPRSPAVRRFRPQQIEVKSLSKEAQKQDVHTNAPGNSRPQSIEVKSIAKNFQKPVVPPKPSCKFKPADLGTMPNEAQRLPVVPSSVRPQSEERPQTIVVSSPTIYRKISNESTSTSHSARKLAVSAVSSIKPPTYKTAAPVNSLSNQSAASSETDASSDRGQPQLPGSAPQSCSNTQGETTLATVPTTTTGPSLTSDPGPVSEPNANQAPAPVPAGASLPSQPAAIDQHTQPPYPRTAYPHEQAAPVAPASTKQLTPVSTTQVPGYAHQTYRRSLSSDRSHRVEEMQFYASDDPPSYDERESFSPLMLQDLTTRRSNRYQPSTRPPPCSCTTGCPSHPGLTPPHHHRSPHNLTPPAPTHSPGQGLPYPVAQPPLRQHQCRPDPQPMSYQPGSPKSSPLGPGQPPAMYQPSHHPPSCPPHPSLMHACPPDRLLQPSQHIDPRRAPVHRSPQQQPPGMAGAPYSDPVHGHSPGLPPMDSQYLCGPQSLGPSYGSEYGGDGSSLYSESSYGQAPRRVLLDPETGKYFYIEVPVQPLRKMLFDPETGQYVEVLIPQQAMSHSGLYPPSAAPYPSLHNPNMYAPASQYMPYAAPPPPAHPQPPPQPPRYPETSAAATMHPSGPGVNYSNPPGQGSKPEPQNHPPLDQSYLESMYYVPTGMNASPNITPPDYYHKHPPNLPPTGGKRS